MKRPPPLLPRPRGRRVSRSRGRAGAGAAATGSPWTVVQPAAASSDRAHAGPRPRIVGDAGKPAAELDSRGQLTVPLEDIANGSGIGFSDNKQRDSGKQAAAARSSNCLAPPAPAAVQGRCPWAHNNAWTCVTRHEGWTLPASASRGPGLDSTGGDHLGCDWRLGWKQINATLGHLHPSITIDGKR